MLGTIPESVKEGGRPIFPPASSGHLSPPPSPVTLGSGDGAAAKRSKEITAGHEEKSSSGGSRQALYLQDCQIPQNKFQRERGPAMGEGEGESIFSCHSDTEVTHGRALPATCAHPLCLPKQQPVSAGFATDLCAPGSPAFQQAHAASLFFSLPTVEFC